MKELKIKNQRKGKFENKKIKNNCSKTNQKLNKRLRLFLRTKEDQQIKKY